ncbi:MAG: ABC transporter ATP-binding protein [Hyphomicrobiales bacterium]|nr:ABC transporter ATP-binding protein [Hyphomicrobiales bacterium]MCP5373926.1 ABC transporter ATP-binding protein [Hyphomicrobiales bacterium]
MALLEVEDLNVTIPTPRGTAHILSDVSFALERGECLGFAGESGCGKSITAMAVMGLLPTTAQATGRIRLDGRDLLAMDEAGLCAIRGRRVAMVFQEPMTALNPVKTIGFQVAEGPRLHLKLSKAEAGRRAVAMLRRVGLPPDRFSPDLYPYQLSGGQRQRVMIAAALACEPDILIADEPTTALDVTIQAQILDLISDVVQETGMALVMITHDLGVIAETAERMMVMYAGRIVESGPTAEVFRHMAHPYTRGLFAAIPGGPEEESRRLATIPGQVPEPIALPPGCAFAGRCARTEDDCRAAVPPAEPVGPGHRVRCLHPHVGAT